MEITQPHPPVIKQLNSSPADPRARNKSGKFSLSFFSVLGLQLSLKKGRFFGRKGIFSPFFLVLGRSQGLNIPIRCRARAEGEREKEGKGRREGKETQEKTKSNL